MWFVTPFWHYNSQFAAQKLFSLTCFIGSHTFVHSGHHLISSHNLFCWLCVNIAVFSLNFSSAVKGPFIAARAKKYAPEVHFPGGRGVVECGTWPHPCWKFRSQVLWNVIPSFWDLFYANQLLCPLQNNLTIIDTNNFTLFSMLSFQNAWAIKRKAVYTLVLFHISIHFLVECEYQIGSQLGYFLT